MSRLTEYLPQTGIVFEDEDENEFDKLRKQYTEQAGGGTSGTKKEAEKPYYEQRSEENRGKPGFKTMDELRAVPGARLLDENTIELPSGARYTLEAGTGDWKASSASYGGKADQARWASGTPLNGGAAGAGATPGATGGGNTGAGSAAINALLSPEARQFGPPDTYSLGNQNGVSIPGWEQYRQPGIGIPEMGRQQLTDRNGLNTMRAGQQGSATQFPVSPGFRAPGQTGNQINFNNSGSPTLEPQMLFGPATASVPGSYVQGQGNVNDSNRAYALPFNIGPGGAALANVAGNNVQVNGPPGSGVGYGFALNAMPASNPFALTGRNASEDPALQAIQTLQLNSALAQGRMGDLMQANPNQFGGNRAGTGNGPFSGNGGMGQGAFWSGYAPDPAGAQFPTSAPAPAPVPGPNPLLGNVAGSTAQGGVAGAADRVSGLGGWGGWLGDQAQALAAMSQGPTMGNPWSGSRDEEDERGGGGGRDFVSYARGGTVNTMGMGRSGLPGFASGGVVNAGSMGPIGSLQSPTVAAPAVDPALGGSLASPGPGAAVQTTAPGANPVVNPAAQAIQPVSSPASQTVITPSGVAPQGQTQAPVQTQAPAVAGSPGPAAAPGGNPLDAFYAAQQKNAMQQRLREQTFGNRWQAGNLSAPTAIQVQPGQQLSPETLAPGQYYDTSGALNEYINQIQQRQLALAGLGEIGDPDALMHQLTQYQGQQAPFKTAQQIQLELQGLGQLGDPAQLSQQMADIRAQNEPLAHIQDLQMKMNEVGPGPAESDIQAQMDYVAGMQSTVDLYGDPDPFTDPHGFAAQQNNKTGLMAAKSHLSNLMSMRNASQQAQANYRQMLAAYNVTPEQLTERLGQFTAQSDALKAQYDAAMKGAGYQNQIRALVGEADPISEFARYQEMINKTNESYGNVEKSRVLNREIGNLAQTGSTLPGFAGGGKVETKERKPSRGEEFMANLGSPPNSGRIMNWFPGFAGGGSMTTQEPIIGIGMYSRQPRFQVGEPQYPGGPPMAERLKIEPLNRPSLPLGGMRRAS